MAADIGAVLVMLSSIRETSTRATGHAQGVVVDIMRTLSLTSEALSLGQGAGRELAELLDIAAKHQADSILCLQKAAECATRVADELMGL